MIMAIDPHYVLTDWATERVGVPDLHNDVAPFLGGQAARRRRDYIGPQGFAGCLLRESRGQVVNNGIRSHVIAFFGVVTSAEFGA